MQLSATSSIICSRGGDVDDDAFEAENDDGVLLLPHVLAAPKTDVEGLFLLPNADTNDDCVVLVAFSRIPKVDVAVLVLAL